MVLNKSIETIEDDEEIGIYNGKQYKITYVNNRTKKNCMIIIGTIDSFIYSIGGSLTNPMKFWTNFKINFDFSKINNSTLNDGSLVNSNDPAANVGFDIGVSF